uniref:Uncharacterized protein n=1 Tax=Arundo donax TaxID=35708 RepID=A0A0A9H911_ARUDO
MTQARRGCSYTAIDPCSLVHDSVYVLEVTHVCVHLLPHVPPLISWIRTSHSSISSLSYPGKSVGRSLHTVPRRAGLHPWHASAALHGTRCCVSSGAAICASAGSGLCGRGGSCHP